MGAPHCAVLAVVISALSFTLPATAQERGNQAPAASSPSDARPMPRTVDKRNDRNNRAVAKRMIKIPEFLEALRNGDANAAKRIFVANGGSADHVIYVPARGWSPITGYNASDPVPADVPINPVVCQTWYEVPWGNGTIWACWGPGKDGHYGWEH
jgi:hypothetical protein